MDHHEIQEEEHAKYEMIDSVEYMQSVAAIPHQNIQGNLYRILSVYLRGKRCKVYTDAKIVFSDKVWMEPDLFVVCDRNKIKKTHIEGAPDFVVEILSPSTQLRDLGIKKDTYEKFGVKEYWIISPEEKTIKVYLLKDEKYRIDNVYHDYTEDEWRWLTEEEKEQIPLVLKLSLYDDLEIDVKEIFED
ncbi:MAG: Uma2 family endonuclease [Selenomonadaceae bacterium]|nr:Uma2 family endonuclease [Selenomonadaceae bacterium]